MPENTQNKDGEVNGNEEQKEKRKTFNPFKIILERRARKKLMIETALLKKEELMKQDLERFLMEIEERQTWVATELAIRNLSRLGKLEELDAIKRRELNYQITEDEKLSKETGLSYYLNTIKDNRRFQNSPAKCWDLKGHNGPVHSCKLSKCLQYIVSCSSDSTVKLWRTSNGKCIMTFYGHSSKKVYDCDLHPLLFAKDQTQPCILTCGSDCNLILWNFTTQNPLKVLTGHTEAIYRCSFSPDGSKILSCSEDQTLRTWCYPECFLLYIYKGHHSPVSSASFSPTGRFIISGSDYGERKLLLWNAHMPVIEDPIHVPHIIFWTAHGLIKKIIIRTSSAPIPSFWLTQSEIGSLSRDAELEVWPGELDGDIAMSDSNSDSDNNDDEEEQEVDDEEEEEDKEEEALHAKRKRRTQEKFGSSDVRSVEGVSVGAIVTDKYGEQTETEEYMPGGSLVISVQSIGKPVTEAFVSIHSKSAIFESFPENSGQKIGQFKVNVPLPWEMHTAIVHPLGLKPPLRVVPEVLSESSDGQSLIFKEVSTGAGLKDVPFVPKFEAVWLSPTEPEIGEAIIVVTYRVREQHEWLRLTHSLKESVIRINAKKPSGDGAAKTSVQDVTSSSVNYLFDQESRHSSLWDFIRDKNWDAVISYFDKKAVLYHENKIKLRRWRVVDYLENIFAKTPSLILQSPIIFKPGCTKSSAMIESVAFEKLSESSDGDGEDESVSLVEEGEDHGFKEEDESNEDEEEVGGTAGEAKAVTPRDAAEGNVPSALDEGGNAAMDDEGQDNQEEVEGEEGVIPPLALAPSSSPEAVEALGDDDDADDDDANAGTPMYSERDGEQAALLAIDEADELGDDDDDGDEQRPLIPAREEKDINVDIDADDVSEISMSTALLPKPLAEALIAAPVPVSVPVDIAHDTALEDSKHKLRLEHIIGSNDNDKDSMGDGDNSSEQSIFGRFKARKLFLKELLITDDIEGTAFDELVDKLARREARAVMRYARMNIAPNIARELRLLTVNTIKEREIAFMSSAPSCLQDRRDRYLVHETRRYDTSEGVEGGGSMAVSKPIEEQSHRDKLIHFFNIASHSFIKTEKFGPDIEYFTMAYPASFPKNAGKAVGFLKVPLYDYGKLLHKMDEGRLPQTLEEALPKKKLKKQKINLKKIQESLIEDVKVNLTLSRTYISTRRPGMAELPGLGKHYPNKNYTAPCIPYSSFQGEYSKKNPDFLKKLFGMRIIAQSYTVPPVGRKPLDPYEWPEIQRNYSLKIPFENNLQKSFSSIRSISSFSLLSSSSKKSNNNITSQFEIGINYPKGVYLGRRGSFPFAPGLSEACKFPITESTLPDLISSGNKNIKNNNGITRGDNNKKVLLKNSEFLQKDDDTFLSSVGGSSKRNSLSEEIILPAGKTTVALQKPLILSEIDKLRLNGGLMRRFTINGYELSHHGAINDCIFSPSEGRIVSAGGDGLIKFWDPRDGTFVRSLRGHNHEVQCVRYTRDELFLVSSGSDSEILIWDLTKKAIMRRMRGHQDVVCRLSISDDCTFIISASFDNLLKTWFTTPRRPDKPEPPKVIKTTLSTAILSWALPPCYDLEPTAFHIQYRIGMNNAWLPAHENKANEQARPISIAPSQRTKVIEGLIPATPYQFRIKAINHMNEGDWSQPSKVIHTAYGLPNQLDVLEPYDVTMYSIDLYFFAPNPSTYGSASEEFDLIYSGEGKDFQAFPTFHVTLKDGIQAGQELFNYYKILVTKKAENISAYGTQKVKNFGLQEKKIKLSELQINSLLSRVQNDDTLVLLGYTVRGLHPGQGYRFQIRGINKAGAGVWSVSSVSLFTSPKEPDAPYAPHVIDSTLTTILFEWYPPAQNGSAITGYRIYIEHTGQYINLERTQTKYLLENLQPGKVYRMQVLAKNSLGWSGYSDLSNADVSHTKIGVPEKPRSLRPVAGSWSDIRLEGAVPFANGSPVSAFIVQRRWVQAFDRGDWEIPLMFQLNGGGDDDDRNNNNLVEFVKYVDIVKQGEDLYKWACEAAVSQNANRSYNPFDLKSKDRKDITPEQILSKEKPESSTIRFTMDGLLADTVYEFRICFVNKAGKSPYSGPSYRAKTNRADPPGTCATPEISMVLASSVTLLVPRPTHGGSEILAYTVEARDLDSSLVLETRHQARLGTAPFLCQIKDLQAKTTYQFRIRAESLVANGEYSFWSEEVELPPGPMGLPVAVPTVLVGVGDGGGNSMTGMNVKLPPKSRFSDV